jgi:hypothetical protein
MSETEFEVLSKHLEEVRPLTDRFCARHGFVYAPAQAIGRYPRIRIEKPGSPSLWIELWMEYDADGRRFETFTRERPYELSAGGEIHVDDGSALGARHQKAIVCFCAMPFENVAARLEAEMQRAFDIVRSWTPAYLKGNGLYVRLGRP